MKKILILLVMVLLSTGFTNESVDGVFNNLNELFGRKLGFTMVDRENLTTGHQYKAYVSGDIEVNMYPDIDKVESIYLGSLNKDQLSKVIEHYNISILEDDALMLLISTDDICYGNYLKIFPNSALSIINLDAWSGGDSKDKFMVDIEFTFSKIEYIHLNNNLRKSKNGCVL